MQDIVECIFAIGLPTTDALLSIALLHDMGGDLTHVQSQVGTELAKITCSIPYTSVDIITHLDLEQHLIDGHSSDSEDVLIACAPNRSSFLKKSCGNSCCPRPQGHDTADCWGPGGAMKGCCEKVLTQKQTVKDKGKSSTASISFFI